MDSWQLVDTSLIMEIVWEFLKNIWENKKVLFDWLPRNLEQYIQFQNVMEKFSRKWKLVYVSLSKIEAIKRLSWRFECVWVDTTNNPLITKEECIKKWWSIKVRDDDVEDSIKKRIEIFFNETLPIIEKYKKTWNFIEINWIQDVDKVFSEIRKWLFWPNIFDKIKKFCRFFRIILWIILILVWIFTWIIWFYLWIIPLIAWIFNFCPLCLITKKCKK